MHGTTKLGFHFLTNASACSHSSWLMEHTFFRFRITISSLFAWNQFLNCASNEFLRASTLTFGKAPAMTVQDG